MSAPTLTPRVEAIRILETDRADLMALTERLSDGELTTPGLGGGEWSPKDLLGHVESWEGYALEALDAWARGERPPYQEELTTKGLNRFNADAVARKAPRSAAETLASAEATHGAIVDALRTVSDERWAAPPTPRHRASLGRRLGGILAGVSSPFTHDAAHLPDLRAFVDERGR